MDEKRFDSLLRSLVTTPSRRGVLGLLVSAALGGLVGLDQETTTAKKGKGKGKGHGKGKGKGKGKRKRKRKGNGPAQNPTGTVQKPTGTRPQCPPTCPQCQTCNTASGKCEPVDDDTPCDNVCATGNSCQAGVCAGTPLANRTSVTGSDICCNGIRCSGCCGSDGSCGPCAVFVTADPLFTGNLGGLSGADDKCRTRASNVGLPGAEIAGNYKAWLSTGTGANESPATGRFRQSGMPYVLNDASHTKVADDWTDLITCDPGPAGECLDHAIDHTETGAQLQDALHVWANTFTDGTAEIGDCDDWGSESNMVGGFGGQANISISIWTTGFGSGCESSKRLYCFQQT